ncbi:hypothetical protein [Flavobacterium sp.]|uniref:hypothetical protein n=1 Tax=Flavobacterium sp. TaxID=239 RepID=UPI0037502D25
MRLHLNFPLLFNFENSIPKETIICSSSIIKSPKKSFRKAIKKINNFFIKLSPLHWYDGVWDDLEYKM